MNGKAHILRTGADKNKDDLGHVWELAKEAKQAAAPFF